MEPYRFTSSLLVLLISIVSAGCSFQPSLKAQDCSVLKQSFETSLAAFSKTEPSSNAATLTQMANQFEQESQSMKTYSFKTEQAQSIAQDLSKVYFTTGLTYQGLAASVARRPLTTNSLPQNQARLIAPLNELSSRAVRFCNG